MAQEHEKTNEEQREKTDVSLETVAVSKEEVQVKKGNIVISKKSLIALAVILVMIAFAYFYKGLFIAATVNGSPISRISVIQSLEKSSGKQALNNLITRKVIADEVRKKNITVSDEEINAGVKEIRDQVAAQGGTLEQVLAQQGVTLDDFEKNQRIQIQVEKLLGDKIMVTDAEVSKYITENKINIPKDQLTTAEAQIRNELRSEKLKNEGQKLVNSLRASAHISYFVEY